MFEIENGTSKNDVDLAKESRIPQVYFQEKEPHYNQELRELFWLKKVADLDIVNDTIDRRRRRLAFVQRIVYTKYEKIKSAKKTSEL